MFVGWKSQYAEAIYGRFFNVDGLNICMYMSYMYFWFNHM